MSLAHSSFKHLCSKKIGSLNLSVDQYEHIGTGASHYHFNADSDENVFLVALRTVPEDSTGVAHILEHTALCGSKKYPVRDPFFMMIRRSLNTFMNALTSSDWTAYPFASLNRKDFDNLLDVYLDAVFFSRLDPMDFAQEGHRLEFDKTDDPNSALMYKGVVFNEMKGAMSSVTSQLWQTLCKYLYPTNTYHYNSGGEPEHITDLSYEQLVNFYRSHYHPSNAIFMTYGSIGAVEHQQNFEDKVLKHFERLDRTINVHEEKRYLAPVRVEEYYAYNDSDSNDDDGGEIESGKTEIKNKTHIVMGWLLGKSTDLKGTMEAHLLSGILFDNSASPLQHALETTDLGTAPSPLCGLDDSQLELCFVCGIDGGESANANAVEDLILNTLKQVAEHGVPKEDVQAALHQLELQQREIGGDSYPYGLQLIFTALTGATHRGDAIGLLDIDSVLNELRTDIENPDYIKNLVKKLLVDNPHRVRLTLSPDPQLAQKSVLAERAKLQAIKESLSEQQKQQIVEQGLALQQRQMRIDDDSILPKVTLSDIPKSMRYVESEKVTEKLPVTKYAVGTNGLCYQQVILNLPQLSEAELKLLPLLTMCITELGINDSDYLAIQKRQAQVVGSISAFNTIRGAVDDVDKVKGFLVLSAKALNRNQSAMTQLLHDTLNGVKFEESARIKELIAQARARREQSVSGSGHSLAMLAAAASMSSVAKLNQELSGLDGIRSLKHLDDSLNDKRHLATLVQQLAALHKKIIHGSKQFLLVSDETNINDHYQALINDWPSINTDKQFASSENESEIQLPKVESSVIEQAWLAGAQVNFCAKAFATVPMAHPDATALTVLGGFLRNGYLHRAIREQGGAYGSGAQQDSNIGAFKFFSYRDPRISGTLNDFDQSLEWLLNENHQWQPVEEAILGVISSIDKPGSPAGEAKQTFHAELHGRSRASREEFRNRALQVTADDLKRVGEKYLTKTAASTAIVTSKGKEEETKKLGLRSVNL